MAVRENGELLMSLWEKRNAQAGKCKWWYWKNVFNIVYDCHFTIDSGSFFNLNHFGVTADGGALWFIAQEVGVTRDQYIDVLLNKNGVPRGNLISLLPKKPVVQVKRSQPKISAVLSVVKSKKKPKRERAKEQKKPVVQVKRRQQQIREIMVVVKSKKKPKRERENAQKKPDDDQQKKQRSGVAKMMFLHCAKKSVKGLENDPHHVALFRDAMLITFCFISELR